jgi:hypothetical protein
MIAVDQRSSATHQYTAIVGFTLFLGVIMPLTCEQKFSKIL